MGILRGVVGLVSVVAVAAAFSIDREKIKNRLTNVLIMVAIQLALTFVLLRTNIGLTILTAVSSFFSWLIDQGVAGVQFVFGGIVLEEGATVFIFHVLMPLVFMSAVIGILNYTGILSFIVKWVGWLINKVTGMGEIESYVPIAATLLGSPQVYMTITDEIPKLTSKQIFTIALPSLSVANVTMVAPYLTMIPGEYVVVAYFLNIFSTLIIASLMAPEDREEKTIYSEENINIDAPEETKEKEPFFAMLSDYMTNGFNIAIAIATMMIGFIGLITMLNNGLQLIIGISFTEIIGYVFSPIAFLIGIPQSDITQVGGLMATKLLTNEFVAMGELTGVASGLTQKSLAMISTYLISFANFGGIGIINGAMKSIDESQGKEVAKYSLKLIIGSILTSALTATIVGFFF